MSIEKSAEQKGQQLQIPADLVSKSPRSELHLCLLPLHLHILTRCERSTSRTEGTMHEEQIKTGGHAVIVACSHGLEI